MVLTLGTHVQQQLAKGAAFGFLQAMATTCVRAKHSGCKYDSRSCLSTTQTHFCQVQSMKPMLELVMELLSAT